MIVLAILDGWGHSEKTAGNAIYHASTPNLDAFMKKYPHALLRASGSSVGLPAGQMGNSEVGHLNIGAGRIVYQEITRISRAIKDRSFFENPVLLEAMKEARGGTLHLMGLIGPGGVHATDEHLYALLKLAKGHGLNNVMVHCFLDGRDTPPKSAVGYVENLEKALREIGVGKIASLVGRYYAMDRDRRWERTKRAYDMLVRGRRRVVGGALEGIAVAYGNEETDEFVQPTVIEGTSRVKDGDVVVFFNFRPDRARQLTQAFVDDDFNRFPTANIRVHFVTMTDYGDQFKVPVAFRKEVLTETFGEVIARYGLSQLRIAETEKYAHVTYFFSGGREKPFPGEDRCLIPSPTVETYDLQPEMSAPAVTEEVVARIDAQRHDVIILNYANADMVGHTGVWEATVRAVETVDACIGTVVKAVQAVNGIIMIISDHGNAEEMVEQGVEKTAHTLNPVPCILIGRNVRLNDGILGDVAPTLLALLGKPQPERMTGTSLIAKES